MNGEVERLMPDPDRRDEAFFRIARAISCSLDAPPGEERTYLRPSECRALQAISVGLDEHGAAAVLGIAHSTLAAELKTARRALRAKTPPTRSQKPSAND